MWSKHRRKWLSPHPGPIWVSKCRPNPSNGFRPGLSGSRVQLSWFRVSWVGLCFEKILGSGLGGSGQRSKSESGSNLQYLDLALESRPNKIWPPQWSPTPFAGLSPITSASYATTSKQAVDLVLRHLWVEIWRQPIGKWKLLRKRPISNGKHFIQFS